MNVVEAFGFVPDGRTDNYQAFRRLAAFATRRGGGRFYFPKGDYWVAKYRTTKAYQRAAFQAERPLDVTNAVFLKCKGLELIGDGASIKLNGAFHRSSELNSEDVVSGRLAAIFMPFEFRHCEDVLVSGFDMDGGVRDMSRDPGVAEAHAYLVSLNACRRVLLRDLRLHHCQTDAILLSDDKLLSGARGTACRDIRLERVKCEHNARGALAALQVLGLTCVSCSFNYSGRGTGAYGHHAPGFGVDVEPDRYLASDVDVKTGNLHFESCEFRDNFSAFLAAYTHSFQGRLRIIDCISTNAFDAPNHMIICWPGALMEGGQHDLGAGTFWTSWSDMTGGDLTIRRSKFRGSGHYGIFHAHAGNAVRLQYVSIVGTHRHATFGTFPAIQADPLAGRFNVVQDCTVFLPKSRKSPKPPVEVVVSLGHAICENNVFETDLTSSEGEFVAAYHRCSVMGDHFIGSFSSIGRVPV